MFSQPPLNAFCQAATGTATTELPSNRASAIVSQYLWSCCQSAKDSCCQTVTQLVPPPLSMFSQTVKAVAQLPTFSRHAQSKSHSTNTAIVKQFHCWCDHFSAAASRSQSSNTAANQPSSWHVQLKPHYQKSFCQAVI